MYGAQAATDLFRMEKLVGWKDGMHQWGDVIAFTAAIGDEQKIKNINTG